MADSVTRDTTSRGGMQNIAVVGCGAIGLTTALTIQTTLENVNVTVIAKDFSPNTTSDISAGYWQPFLLGDTPQDKIFKWSKITYDYLLRLWKEGKASEAGITLIPAIVLTNAEKPDWLKITLGYSDLSRKELTQYSMKLNQNFTNGFIFLSFTWEPSVFIPYFQNKFLEAGGRITKRSIFGLQDLKEYDLIVNCTGLESKIVVGDPLLKPIRGQICRVTAPSIFHITVTDIDPPCYVIPNMRSVVLGGTKEVDDNLYVDDNDTNIILKNCAKLVPALKTAEIVKHQVGLRPGRNRVRLEAEIKRNGNNALRIVHNYGHGGAGITLSMGCAVETAELARQILQDLIKNKL